MSANATRTSMSMAPSDGGVLHQMWIPCVVFAHMFAGYFLLRMLTVMYPKAWADIKRKLFCRGSLKDQQVHAAKGGKAAAAVSPKADTRRTSDQGKGLTVDQAAPDSVGARDAGAGPDDTPFGVATHVYGNLEDEEMGLPADNSNRSGNGASVPTQHSQLLMRRLTVTLKPIVMEWQDVGCSYNTSGGLKTVLKSVWGHANPGDMLALMGPSGAGKSTLMDILAGRKSVGNLTGAVLVNGRPRKQAAFARKTAYVPQDDNFMPTMTVIETCSYYATLTLPRSWSKQTVRERIREVLAAMGLNHTLNTLVGGTLPGGIILRGLSGGERKRLSIATGIMSTPCIVFLDEPTSGLDSFAALSVMSYMRSMAAGGQTVVSSIHQPRAAIWALFDKVTLLSMGHLMYFGARENLVNWFTDGCGYPYDPKMHGLASDWVMDLVNIGFKKPEALFGRMINTMAELETAASAFRKRYLSSAHGHTAIQGLTPYSGNHQAIVAAAGTVTDDVGGAAEAINFDGSNNNLASINRMLDTVEEQNEADSRGLCGLGAPRIRKTSASWFTQFRVLLWREFLSITRNPADVAGRCLIFCWLAIFVGLIYYNLSNSVDSLRSRLNVLFVEPVILLLLPYVYMSLYTADKQYYIADSSAKLYHPSAYYLAKQMAVMPFAILNVLLFSFTLYGLAGLRHEGYAVGMNGLMSVLMYLIAAQVLSFAAVVTPNQDLAFMLAIAWTAINLLLSNFMVRYVDMSQGWFSQLRYISAMGYGFEGYTRAEFRGVTYSCAGGLAPTIIAYIPSFLPNTTQINSPIVRNALSNPGPDCTVRLDSILDYFELFRPFWEVVVILLAYLGFFHIITYLGFLWLTKKEKR